MADKSQKMKITVIGESNIDVFVQPLADPSHASQQTCTPSRIRFHHGGVARNIAHNLSLLGHEVQLVTVFGDDDFGKGMMAECQALGIKVSLSDRYENAQSPIFLSFNDKNGAMQSAVSDVELNNRMDLDWLKGKMNEINRSEMVVADTLLSAEALTYLIDHCQAPLYIDTVSPGKAKRLSEALNRSEKPSIFALKCNLAEALAITGEMDLDNAAKELNDKGINNIYLSIGSNGVVYCTEGKPQHFPSLSTEVVNVTGSGDAFFAGVIHAHALGILGKKAVMFGLRAAQHNIKSEGPVNQTLRHSILPD